MTLIQKTFAVLAALLISFGLGLGAGWRLYRTKPLPPSVISDKPPIILHDHSVVTNRIYVHDAPPNMEVPQGDQVEEQGMLTVQSGSLVGMAPISGSDQKAEPLPASSPCPPVKIEWAVLTEPDGGKRVQFKAVTGSIIGVPEDIEVRPPAPIAEPPKWSAGASRYLREKSWGIWLERKAGPFVVGAEVKQYHAEFGNGKTSADGAVRFGLQF